MVAANGICTINSPRLGGKWRKLTSKKVREDESDEVIPAGDRRGDIMARTTSWQMWVWKLFGTHKTVSSPYVSILNADNYEVTIWSSIWPLLIARLRRHRSLFFPAFIPALFPASESRGGKKMRETTKKEEKIKLPWTSSMGRLCLPGFFSIINLCDCSCLLIAAFFFSEDVGFLPGSRWARQRSPHVGAGNAQAEIRITL